MKRLWNCGERATTVWRDVVNSLVGTSFLSRSARGHTSDTRAVAGDLPGVVRCAPAHVSGTARLAGDLSGYLGGFPGLTGDLPGVASGVPNRAMSLPSVAMSLPSAARCVSRRTGCVSGVVGDISDVDRCMEIKDLCGFYRFAIFPFGAVKQNTEKQQKHDKTQK